MKQMDIPKHFRMVALQCDFEGGEKGTLAKPALWKEFGFNYEQLFHTHAELYSAVFEKEKHAAILEKYLDEEKKNGIDVILYLNCHILLESQRPMFPEWAIVDKNGSYAMLYGTYGACCLNSSWMDYFCNAIESLKGYDIKGIFFDGPVTVPCYCPRCRAKFKASHNIEITDADEKLVNQFAVETTIEAKKIFYDKVKSVNPSWAAYFNEHLLYCNKSTEQMKTVLACNDIVGTEGGFQFYGPAKDANLWRCGACAKMAEASADGKPTVIFMAGDQKSWNWYLHSPAESTLMYMSTIANGASVWYGLHCSSDILNSETGRTIKELVNFDKKHDSVYRNTKCASQIAVFHSFETNRFYTAKGETTDLYKDGTQSSSKFIGNYTNSFNGAVHMLFRSNLSFDIICELNIEELFRYSVLVLPTYAFINDDALAKIKQFVKDGGILISDSETSLYNLKNEKLDNFALADVFGADYSGTNKSYNPFDYFQHSSELKTGRLAEINYLPAPLSSLDIAPTVGSEIIGRLCPPLTGRYSAKPSDGVIPFIVKNKYGKGTSYYFAGTFFELYNLHSHVLYRELFKSIINKDVKLDFELVGAPESVDMTIRKNLDSGEIVIHLLNYTGGMSRPIDKLVPVNGLKIRSSQKITKATALKKGCELKVVDGSIILPGLDDFEVVVVSL